MTTVHHTRDGLGTLSLGEMAELANVEHRLANEAFSAGLVHGIYVGQVLLVARESVLRAGDRWEVWMSQNLSFSPEIARTYVRLAHYEPEVQAWAAAGGRGGINGALAALKHQPPTLQFRWESKEAQAAAARRLHRAGLSTKAIAEALGVSWDSVRRWTDATYRSNRKQAKAKAKQRHDAARRALAEKEERAERNELAKSAGGAIEKAYAAVRQTCAALDQALDGVDGSQRLDLRAALAAAHKAEEAIVAALRSQRRAAA